MSNLHSISFLDASLHLYNRLRLSIHRSVGPSVRRSVHLYLSTIPVDLGGVLTVLGLRAQNEKKKTQKNRKIIFLASINQNCYKFAHRYLRAMELELCGVPNASELSVCKIS